MANFQVYSNTPSSAVATAGTIAFTIPANLVGSFKYEQGHVLFAEGLQSSFLFGQTGGFTIAWSAATATVTYKGTTSIPANTVVKLMLCVAGEQNYIASEYPPADNYYDYLKTNPRTAVGREMRVLFGSPAAASATAVLATTAVTVTTVNTLATPYQLDIPRNLQFVSSNAGDTTQTITVRSLDELGNAMTETISLNGTTIVAGKKAHYTVISYQASASLAGNLSIGSNTAFGFPFFVPGGTGAGSGFIVKESMDGATATAGTTVGGDLTLPTATTGDVRGTYVPNTAANGTHIYEVLVYGSDLSFRGLPQFAG